MNKKAFLTEQKAREIIEKYPTPFHIYDEKGIRANAKAVKEAFSWNKGFKEYFAVKANPNPFLMKIFKDYDFGFDCSSMTELMLCEAIDAVGENIMFSANDMPPEEFAKADELGGIINLDDFTHIEILEKTVGHIPEVVSCRYNPGGVVELSNGIMDNPGDSKYGMTKEQLFEAYRILSDKGAKRLGLHAFLVSNTVTNEYYPTLARQLFELVVEIKEKTGVELSFVNLSGGVGIAYRPDQTPNDIYVIGEGVKEAFEEILVPAQLENISIYTEMGRFMMGPYGALVTTAIHEKHIYKEYIGVDACAANLMRPAMYGAYHHVTVLGKEDAPCDHTYDVVGALCENNDKFAVDRELPKIDKGDIIYIHDTGAHGFSMGYNYNGRLWSAEILLKEDGSFELIRRAETPKDYFATFDCFDEFKNLGSEVKGNKVERTDDMPENYAFVDGSFNSSTGVYGYGGFVVAGDTEYPLSGSASDAEAAKSRNVAGEVLGAMEATKKAMELGLKELTMFYDYEGIAKWAKKEWKRNIKLTQDYEKFMSECGINIEFVHVKAHSGIPGNERADEMAKEAVGIN